jgi:SAM-dependent methyltransferase
MSRLPDGYFDRLYSAAPDPWDLGARWYEQRKYAITMALLPRQHYRHAFEPGCSVGVLTGLLAQRCDHVTACDVAAAALQSAQHRLDGLGHRDRVTLLQQSLDQAWPASQFDLLMLSEVGYYFAPDALRSVLDRECPRLADGATVVAAHWRHRVDDYLMAGDRVNEVVAQTAGLHPVAQYRDADVVIDVFDTADGTSVATRTGVPVQ